MTSTDAKPASVADGATTRMTIKEHIEVVAAEGRNFAAAARRGDLEAPVPACPGWTVRDLVRHLGEIHLWAAGNLAQRPGSRLDLDDRSELAESWPDLAIFWPEDEQLIDWYLRTNANLVHVLEAVPPDVAADTFLPAPSPLAMWARRQAHETSIHRFDAESATGTTTGYGSTFAADGVDELLYAFYASVARTAGRQVAVDGDRLMHVRALDTEDSWCMRISPGSITAAPDGGPADVTLRGTASDLYLALWNRGDGSTITVTGDRKVLQAWHNHTGVRWHLD